MLSVPLAVPQTMLSVRPRCPTRCCRRRSRCPRRYCRRRRPCPRPRCRSRRRRNRCPRRCCRRRRRCPTRCCAVSARRAPHDVVGPGRRPQTMSAHDGSLQPVPQTMLSVPSAVCTAPHVVPTFHALAVGSRKPPDSKWLPQMTCLLQMLGRAPCRQAGLAKNCARLTAPRHSGSRRLAERVVPRLVLRRVLQDRLHQHSA